jgi:hypothetical protein
LFAEIFVTKAHHPLGKNKYIEALPLNGMNNEKAFIAR